MKRKVTAFPSASSCPAAVASPPLPTKAAPASPQPLVPEKAHDVQVVDAPHALTEELVSYVKSLEQQSVEPGAVAYCATRTGMVRLTVRAGDTEGFGCRDWPVIIGGESFEGGPVAVRFGAPISLPGVDDTGRVHGLFAIDDAKNSSSAALLQFISKSIVALLRGERVLAPHTLAHFALQQQHTLAKWRVADTYRRSCIAPELLDPDTNDIIGGDDSSRPGQIRAEWLQPPFASLILPEGGRVDWSSAAREVSPGIFSLALFTPAFCDLLVREVEHFEQSDLPRRRPNTMNNYGLVVGETGMHGLMSHLLSVVIGPASAALYPREAFANSLDHHHSFCVQYRARLEEELYSTGDEGLDMHQDSSEVTLNVCLGKDFEYGGLVFCGRTGEAGVRQMQYAHRQAVGEAVIHLGRHRHGAAKITRGERCNLIVWARSSAFRAAAAAGVVMPDGFPKAREHLADLDRVCLSAANDEDYVERLRAFQ